MFDEDDKAAINRESGNESNRPSSSFSSFFYFLCHKTTSVMRSKGDFIEAQEKKCL